MTDTNWPKTKIAWRKLRIAWANVREMRREARFMRRLNSVIDALPENCPRTLLALDAVNRTFAEDTRARIAALNGKCP